MESYSFSSFAGSMQAHRLPRCPDIEPAQVECVEYVRVSVIWFNFITKSFKLKMFVADDFPRVIPRAFNAAPWPFIFQKLNQLA